MVSCLSGVVPQSSTLPRSDFDASQDFQFVCPSARRPPATFRCLSTVKFSVAAVAAGMCIGSVTADVTAAAGIETPATTGNLMGLSGEFASQSSTPVVIPPACSQLSVIRTLSLCDKSAGGYASICIICGSRGSAGLSRALLSLYNSLTWYSIQFMVLFFFYPSVQTQAFGISWPWRSSCCLSSRPRRSSSPRVHV